MEENQFVLRILSEGMDYPEYLERMRRKIIDSRLWDEAQRRAFRMDYVRLNYQRSLRIQKKYQVSESIAGLIRSIREPQTWMIITEDWCGDSAQTVPYIHKMISASPMISLRIILRDNHPEIMDRYLTDGKRSIPILVIFNQAGKECFKWGPRPKEAQALFLQLKAAGVPGEVLQRELHSWYARNGRRAIEEEYFDILSRLYAGLLTEAC